MSQCQRNMILRSLPTLASVRILTDSVFQRENKRTWAPGCCNRANSQITGERGLVHRLRIGGAASYSKSAFLLSHIPFEVGRPLAHTSPLARGDPPSSSSSRAANELPPVSVVNLCDPLPAACAILLVGPSKSSMASDSVM